MRLFLSPHFDDGALSCGGLIHRLARQGDPVRLLTIMAGDPPDPLPDTPLIHELHARWNAGVNPVAARREEDRVAAQLLNAQLEFAFIPDCVYRTADAVPLYPDGESIFGAIHPDDPARQALASILSAQIGALRNEARLVPTKDSPTLSGDPVLYAPLGAGHHVDHQLVTQWLLGKMNDLPFPARFYEDYPYSEDNSTLQQALDLFPVRLEPETIFLDEADYEAKCAAIAAYTSQISTFWESPEEMRARIRAHMFKTGDGHLAERCWRVSP